jgi:uncharacterized membrane protein
MHYSSPHYFPLALPFLLVLFLLVVLLITLIEVGILGYAYEKLGIDRRYVFTLLALSFFGSYINIPLFELPAREIVSNREVWFFGMNYIVPFVQEWDRTIVAVNVGGAVLPIALSIYLLVTKKIYLRAFIGVAIVSVIVYWLAEPVAGVGIAVPTLVPPILAAVTALLLDRHNAPPLAYIAGSLGTLIGADLMNLGKIQGLGAPIASIGGAGTFDGIFLTGIIAVLLA